MLGCSGTGALTLSFGTLLELLGSKEGVVLGLDDEGGSAGDGVGGKGVFFFFPTASVGAMSSFSFVFLESLEGTGVKGPGFFLLEEASFPGKEEEEAVGMGVEAFFGVFLLLLFLLPFPLSSLALGGFLEVGMVGWSGTADNLGADRSQSLILELFLLPAVTVLLVVKLLEGVVGPDMSEQETSAGVFKVGTPCIGELREACRSEELILRRFDTEFTSILDLLPYPV